jgi:hypothetical protein
LSHITSPLCLSYFWDRVLLYVRESLKEMFHIAGMTRHHHAQSLLIEMGPC